jgi:hypothetical protein
MVEMFEVTDTFSSYVDDELKSAMRWKLDRGCLTKEGSCQNTMRFPLFAISVEYAVAEKAVKSIESKLVRNRNAMGKTVQHTLTYHPSESH